MLPLQALHGPSANEYTDDELVPLWFDAQQFPDQLMKPVKRKAPMTQNPVCKEETPPSSPPPQASLPQQFSALVAKYALENERELDDGCFAGNEGDENDTDTSDNDSDSGNSDDEMQT